MPRKSKRSSGRPRYLKGGGLDVDKLVRELREARKAGGGQGEEEEDGNLASPRDMGTRSR
jgi:hypothetical protein